MLTPDAKLMTETEIRDRLASIARQRDDLCETPKRPENSNAFQRRQAKIAKLTDRESSLLVSLRAKRA